MIRMFWDREDARTVVLDDAAVAVGVLAGRAHRYTDIAIIDVCPACGSVWMHMLAFLSPPPDAVRRCEGCPLNWTREHANVGVCIELFARTLAQETD